MFRLHRFGRIPISVISRFALRLIGRDWDFCLEVVIEFSCQGALHQAFGGLFQQSRLAQDVFGALAIGQQIVEQVIDTIRFLLSSWHNAVS